MIRSLVLLVSLAAGVSAAAVPSLVRNPFPMEVDEAEGELIQGNFGGDAADDLVVVPRFGAIRTFLNVAGGPFSAPVRTQVPDSMVSAASGHFDADGFLDLVIGIWPQKIVIYHGNGDGTFRRGAVVDVADHPRAIAVTDFNGDGHADVVLGGFSAAVTVHLGGGNGQLGPGITTAVSGAPERLLTADFNGDAKADLVLSGTSATSVALGLGDGRFSPGFTRSGGSGAAVGDFDRDTKLDLFVAADAYGTFHLHRGAGDGTFLAPTTHRLVGNPGAARLQTADVDGDGNPDVVAASDLGTFSSGGSRPLGVLRGNGDGTFHAPEYWIADSLSQLHTGDFDRDGKVDLVYRVAESGGALLLLHGTGGGAFDGHRAFEAASAVAEPREVVGTSAADMNGDGKPDLVVVTGTDYRYQNELAVFLNDGAGNWAAPLFTPLEQALYSPQPVIGDVNGDGKLDVVTGDATHLGNGDGTFQAPIPFQIHGSGPTFLADVTGDGKLDLLNAVDFTGYPTTYVYHGSGTGSFTPAGTVPVRVGGVADFNGDGRVDIAGRSYSHNATRVGINNGSGGFTLSDADPVYVEEVVTAADFNGDGRADLLLSMRDGTRVVFGRGDGTFGDAVFLRSNVSFWLRTCKTADVDGDGALDVIVGGELFLGDGAGRFRSYAAVRGANGLSALADFDGDGDVDLAVTGGAFIALVRPNSGPDPLVTPAMTLVASPAAPRYGTPVTYQATLSPRTVEGHGGAILLSEDGVPVRLFVLQSGWYPSLTHDTAFRTGTHSVTARYTGDSHHAPVTQTRTHEVARATTEISGPIRPRACAAEIAIEVGLESSWGGEILPGPSGAVTFRVGSTVLPSRLATDFWGHYVSGLGVGTHTVVAEYAGDANFEPSSMTFTQVVTPPYSASVSAGSAVYRNEGGNVASIAVSSGSLTGSTFTWSVTNGTIESGQGTSRIVYTAGASGPVTLQATISKSGTPCVTVVSTTVPVIERPAGASMLYVTGPCRLLDTRSGAPQGGSAVASVMVAGNCSVPAGAKSVVVNIAVIAPASSGWMSLYPADLPWPGTATVNYRSGKTRANNAVVPLSADGRLHVRNSGSDVHYVIDVYGYFK